MRRFVSSSGVLTLAAAGIVVAGALAPVGGASPLKSSATGTRITVTASEFKFALSKKSIPAGSMVIFTVINKGKIAHDFKIAGKKTPSLAPGKSAKLTVTFPKKGQSAYLCTLAGHAAAGMKGTFAVGVAPVTPKPATTTAAPTPTPAPTSTAAETLQGDPVAGAVVFRENGCGACHTLAAAGTSGTVGPSLDARKPSQIGVRSVVQSGATAGGNIMPQFNLSATDLNNIAAYVYQSTH